MGNLSPRSAGIIRANNPYSLFGSYQSPIPYGITSPPHQPFSKAGPPDDVSDDEDDDDDDVISLSTIPEVPSVIMAGTLSHSEFLELGATLGNKYRRRRAAEREKRTKTNEANTRVYDKNNTGTVAFNAHQRTVGDRSDIDKSMALRRRRWMMLLTCVVIVFFVIFAAVVVIIIILGE